MHTQSPESSVFSDESLLVITIGMLHRVLHRRDVHTSSKSLTHRKWYVLLSWL